MTEDRAAGTVPTTEGLAGAARERDFITQSLKSKLFRDLESRAGDVDLPAGSDERRECVNDLWQRIPADAQRQAVDALVHQGDRLDASPQLPRLRSYIAPVNVNDEMGLPKEEKTARQEQRVDAKYGALKAHYDRTPSGGDAARAHLGRANVAAGEPEDAARRHLWQAFEQRIGPVQTRDENEARTDLWSRVSPQWRAEGVRQATAFRAGSPFNQSFDTATTDIMLSQASGHTSGGLAQLKRRYQNVPEAGQSARAYLAKFRIQPSSRDVAASEPEKRMTSRGKPPTGQRKGQRDEPVR